MTISIHPARRASEDVPPGTWEGTKQDAVLATAQLRDFWERKKAGRKAKYGHCQYDSQMANAQLRAFKLTKVILRKARKQSTAEIPIMIEGMGFQVDSSELDGFEPESDEFPLPAPPPTAPLPTPPILQRHPRSKLKSRHPALASHTVAPASVPLPPSKFPAPVPPRKSPNRLSQLPPPVKISQRRFSEEVSPRTMPRTISPNRMARPGSPVPHSVSPRHEPETRRRTAEIQTAILPSRTPASRVFLEDETMLEDPTPFEHRDTPLPDPEPLSRKPAQINSSTKVQRDITPPLNTKRRSLVRAASFKFGEGLHNYSLARTSSLLYAELSDALKDLQRTIGTTAVEVH